MKNAVLCRDSRSASKFDLRDRFFRKLAKGTPLGACRKLQFSVSQSLQERLLSLKGFVTPCFAEGEFLLESENQLVHLVCRGGGRQSSLASH